jgi:hypothetical protein
MRLNDFFFVRFVPSLCSLWLMDITPENQISNTLVNIYYKC